MKWEKLARVSLDMICAFNGEGFYTYTSEACYDLLGYQSSEMVGRHYLDLVHPEDIAITEETSRSIYAGSRQKSFENRLLHKNGQTVYVLWSASWDEEDGTMYCVARDLTEFELNRQKLIESEQRYKALFENNPDVIFLESTDGLLLEVNKAFCEKWGITREEAVNRSTASFFPKDLAVAAQKSLQDALSGTPQRNTVDMVLRNERRFYDTIKFPVSVNGEVVGAQTISKDITPMVDSYATIQQQAHNLNSILESITDGFLAVDRQWRITYLNGEAEKMLPFDRTRHIGANIWELFPEEVGHTSYIQCLHAMETGQTVTYTFQLKRFAKWFKVKAYPSGEGLSIFFDDITEQVTASQELENLSLVASKTVNSVVLMDSQGQIEWVNDSFTTHTGYSFNEARGKTPFELFLAPALQAPTTDLILNQLEQNKPFKEELPVCTKSGERKWFEVEITPVFNEQGELIRHIGVQVDITERVKSQQEIRKLSLVASKTNNGVMIINEEGVTEWANEGFTRMFGYSIEEAIGRRAFDLLHHPSVDPASYVPIRDKLFRGESASFDILNRDKHGGELWSSVEISPILEDGNDRYKYVIVQTDITALKNSELELSKLTKDLYRQNADLQQFTYLVSHNLRAPVANAMGLADHLLTLDKDSDRFNTSLAYLRQSIYQLDTVVRDMGTILSIREGTSNLTWELVDLRDVFGQALTSFQEQIDRLGARVQTDMEEGLRVRGSKAYLHSIFYNLLSNAIKYRAEQRQLEIHIRCFSAPERGTTIRFSDNGTGFNVQKEEKNLFKLYKRFHPKQEGRGMGLYLVKSHLNAMNGSVEVNSEVGRGTEFIIYLPPNG